MIGRLEDQPAKRLLGVVLCGGRSTRMGRDKAVVTLADGTPFLDLAFGRLEQLCGQAILSTAPDRPIEGYQQVVDQGDSKGPLSGILSSLQWASRHGFQACLFNPVDTPNLSATELEKLVVRWRQLPDRVICATVLETGQNRLEPLISVIPITKASRLRTCFDAGHYGVQQALNEMDPIRVGLPKNACLNINSPTDLHQLNDEP